LEESYINKLEQNLPEDISERYRKMKEWGIPEDTYIYILSKNLFPLVKKMLPEFYEHPKMDFESVLTSIKFKKLEKENILSRISFLKDKFDSIKRSDKKQDAIDWMMGQMREIALGNISLTELNQEITKSI
jgi:glutamyl-tRNA(Gln) amidotransferase subunit E